MTRDAHGPLFHCTAVDQKKEVKISKDDVEVILRAATEQNTVSINSNDDSHRPHLLAVNFLRCLYNRHPNFCSGLSEVSKVKLVKGDGVDASSWEKIIKLHMLLVKDIDNNMIQSDDWPGSPVPYIRLNHD